MRQGIFDQKSWEAKQSEKNKPNPTFRIRFGPGDILIHRPSGLNRPLDGQIKLTKFHITAVEEVYPSTIVSNFRVPLKDKHNDYLNDKPNIPPLHSIVMARPWRSLHPLFNSVPSQIRPLYTWAHSDLWTSTNLTYGISPPSSSTTIPQPNLNENSLYQISSKNSFPAPYGTISHGLETQLNGFSST